VELAGQQRICLYAIDAQTARNARSNAAMRAALTQSPGTIDVVGTGVPKKEEPVACVCPALVSIRSDPDRTAVPLRTQPAAVGEGSVTTVGPVVPPAAVMVTSRTAHWPAYVVEVGLGLSLLAGALYLGTVRSRLRIEANKGT